MPRATSGSARGVSKPTPLLQTSTAGTTDNTPVHAIRHRSLKASIWRNETAKGPMYKVTVVRSYRENNEWRDTHSFAFDDLMNVAKLLADAHSWICIERARENADRPKTEGADRSR